MINGHFNMYEIGETRLMKRRSVITKTLEINKTDIYEANGT